MALSDQIAITCQTSFNIGRLQKTKKQRTQINFFNSINWIQGIHKPIFWAAYKSGLWVRDNGADNA